MRTRAVACVVALVALAWAARMRIVNSIASWAAGVDVEIETLSLLANDTHSATLLLEDIRVLMPQSSDVFASVQSARVELHRESNFVILGDCAISGVAFQFVAYDALLSDTNVRRLLLAMYPNEEAATESSYVTYQRVALSDVTINPELRSDGYSVSLPAITLLGETLEGEVLHGAGVSVSLLNWLAGVVIHALASTTLDGVGGALDGGVALLASTIEVALDVVSVLSTNKIAKRGRPADTRGSGGGAARRRRPRARERRARARRRRRPRGGGGRAAHAHRFASGRRARRPRLCWRAEDGAAAVADGAASGAARLIEVLRRACRSTRRVLRGCSETSQLARRRRSLRRGASSVVGGWRGPRAARRRGWRFGTGGWRRRRRRAAAFGGLADGGVAAVSGLARGLGAAAGSAARGDPAGVVEGGGGAASASSTALARRPLARPRRCRPPRRRAQRRALPRRRPGEGVGAVARGVLEPVDDVASAAAALVTGGGGVDRCTTTRCAGAAPGGAKHVRICAAG